MSREAWFCPSCQKHHAPHCDTCPGVMSAGDPWGLRGLPTFTPSHLRPEPDPCAGCNGPCANAACPRLHTITLTTAAGAFVHGFEN